MRATIEQTDLVERLTGLGFTSSLIGSVFGIERGTANRAWSGAWALWPDQLDWLTRFAAWASRNPPPRVKVAITDPDQLWLG